MYIIIHVHTCNINKKKSHVWSKKIELYMYMYFFSITNNNIDGVVTIFGSKLCHSYHTCTCTIPPS